MAIPSKKVHMYPKLNSIPSLQTEQYNASDEEHLILTAKTDRGFFGLNELHDFFVKRLDSAIMQHSVKSIILDLSSVSMWDVSALLWMSIAFEYYLKISKKKEYSINLRLQLPESKGMVGQQRVDFQKSADFLRRWGFAKVLCNMADTADDLLIDEQKGYFEQECEFYLPNEVEQDGILQELMSLQLAEIRNLCNVNGVSIELVNKVKLEFTAARFGDVLHNQCGFSKDVGSQFSNQILNEGIRNVKEHPHASMGMVALGSLGRAKRLVLAVVDNGDPIPKTIYKQYLGTIKKKDPEQAKTLPATLPDAPQLSSTLAYKLIVHATEPGVTRKSNGDEDESDQILLPFETDDTAQEHTPGYGLTYIRDDSTHPRTGFGGELIIASGGISVRFSRSLESEELSINEKNYGFPWPGNLIRVSIPIRRERDSS